MIPTLRINGQTITPTVDEYAPRLALGRMRIRWGRDSITESPGPQASTVEVLDLNARVAAWENNTFIGAKVEVLYGSRVLLHGRVTAQDAEEIALQFGRRTRTAVKTTLTVTDTWGLLEKMRPHGTYRGANLRATGGVVYSSIDLPYGIGGWPSETTMSRLSSLRDIAKQVIPEVDMISEAWAFEPESPSRSNAPRSRQAGVKVTELLPLSTLLQRCYAAAKPLGWAELRPGDRITQGEPVSAGSVHLRATASRISLVIERGITSIEPTLVTVDDPHEMPSSTAGQRVRSVSVALERRIGVFHDELINQQTRQKIRDRGVDEEDLSRTFTTMIAGAGDSVTELSIDAGATASFFTPKADGDPSTAENVLQGDAAARQLSSRSAELMGYLNDWATLPELTVTDYRMIRAESLGPILLRGNRFAEWASVPAQYQLIGGDIEYSPKKKAMRHKVRLAPVIDPARRLLTTDEVFSPISTPIGRIDRAIWLRDLCLLNKQSEQL